ncbi:MAG: DUF1453 domain-containing protein [Clostridiales bacterium]|jgi:hypothetical protein|nr:DUF1453 domain-containing protein [Clostridiales bacterium]
MNFLMAIIKGTPVYVWVILALLISRAIAASKDSPVSVRKSMLMPAIFIVWGLEKVIDGFGFPAQSLITYVISAAAGTGLGYLLYSKTLKFEMREGVFTRLGSPVPGVVIIVNFVVKYVENVAMAVDKQLLLTLWYNITYCVISGLTVGLFIGGTLNTAANRKQIIN